MDWTMKHIFQIFGWGVLIFVYSCGSEPATTANKPATETQPVNTAVAPNATESAPAATATNKPKHLSIDTNSNASRANYEKPTASTPSTPSPIINPEKLHEKPIGPPGFVTRDGTVLYAKPNSGSAHLATMKKTENVYILETSLTDENGQLQTLPTWYKVQRKTKQKETGWVKGNSLDSGGGG